MLKLLVSITLRFDNEVGSNWNTADIYTVIRRDVPKNGFSVVQANTHRLTEQSKRESMFWNVSTNYCIYISAVCNQG